jgi:lipopolysaccharide export system permease protein
MPIVFAILIFIIFHFINTFGKKVAQQNEIAPLIGSWMSTFVLAPLAILLTKTATDDKGFNINFDWFTNFINRFNPIKNETLVVATVPSIGTFDVKKDIEAIEDNVSKPDTKQISKSETKPLMSMDLDVVFKQYRHYSLFSLLGYFALLLVPFLADVQNTSILVVLVIIGVGFYGALYKAQSILQKIGAQTNSPVDLKTFIVLLGAFPFYPLFYIYNRMYLKEVQSNYHTQT